MIDRTTQTRRPPQSKTQSPSRWIPSRSMLGRPAVRQRKSIIPAVCAWAVCQAIFVGTVLAKDADTPTVPDPVHAGGEAESLVQVANLVYAGSKSSECFADHFLIRAENESTISTSRRFHAVKLSSADIYNYPLLIMTGEGEFVLGDSERTNLLAYLKRGGFLLASSGCSSTQWDRSFRREVAKLFDGVSLEKLEMSHPIFHTVNDIDELTAKHGDPKPLEGISIGDRLVLLYSQDGLNDTSHTQGCCCCGGNEITNAELVNVNILAYTLSY